MRVVGHSERELGELVRHIWQFINNFVALVKLLACVDILKIICIFYSARCLQASCKVREDFCEVHVNLRVVTIRQL